MVTDYTMTAISKAVCVVQVAPIPVTMAFLLLWFSEQTAVSER